MQKLYRNAEDLVVLFSQQGTNDKHTSLQCLSIEFERRRCTAEDGSDTGWHGKGAQGEHSVPTIAVSDKSSKPEDDDNGQSRRRPLTQPS